MADRQTETARQRDRDRETDGQIEKDRQAETERDTQKQRHRDTAIDRHRDRQRIQRKRVLVSETTIVLPAMSTIEQRNVVFIRALPKQLKIQTLGRSSRRDDVQRRCSRCDSKKDNRCLNNKNNKQRKQNKQTNEKKQTNKKSNVEIVCKGDRTGEFRSTNKPTHARRSTHTQIHAHIDAYIHVRKNKCTRIRRRIHTYICACGHFNK